MAGAGSEIVAGAAVGAELFKDFKDPFDSFKAGGIVKAFIA